MYNIEHINARIDGCSGSATYGPMFNLRNAVDAAHHWCNTLSEKKQEDCNKEIQELQRWLDSRATCDERDPEVAQVIGQFTDRLNKFCPGTTVVEVAPPTEEISLEEEVEPAKKKSSKVAR